MDPKTNQTLYKKLFLLLALSSLNIIHTFGLSCLQLEPLPPLADDTQSYNIIAVATITAFETEGLMDTQYISIKNNLKNILL